MCELQPMKGNDKSYFWSAYDCSDEEPAIEKIAIRLQTLENALKFKEFFEAARTYVVDKKAGKDVIEAPAIEDKEDEEEPKKEDGDKKEEPEKKD
eukprot:NODE_4174_length_689_cov_75.714062_g3543_i0.p2 GENE.NODE_4174_length_689_cov_75.714062_g3543_i0~~NODE_4174_length_689_cov_75.714062_g3543_i0.p2  ORF type:complete len:95 (-),score=23.84 NODE_4174_length_689_cov_75.714062_g3543_i0:74-358(-)